MSYRIVLGNRNYSSWSLRAWLVLRLAHQSFEQVVLDLSADDILEQKAAYTTAGRVPVLIQGDLTVWDSLAITEYLAERHADKGIWPEDVRRRAWARSICAEMHAGFMDLRSHWPMNIRKRFERPPTAGVQRDINRIQHAWGEARTAHHADGSFLFGDFCAADAFFAPVATRFVTYGAELDATNQAYVEAVLDHEFMREWTAAAVEEAWEIPEYEFRG